jgi:hypothetical protein
VDFSLANQEMFQLQARNEQGEEEVSEQLSYCQFLGKNYALCSCLDHEDSAVSMGVHSPNTY